jgi:hypothetical protein
LIEFNVSSKNPLRIILLRELKSKGQQGLYRPFQGSFI